MIGQLNRALPFFGRPRGMRRAAAKRPFALGVRLVVRERGVSFFARGSPVAERGSVQTLQALRRENLKRLVAHLRIDRGSTDFHPRAVFIRVSKADLSALPRLQAAPGLPLREALVHLRQAACDPARAHPCSKEVAHLPAVDRSWGVRGTAGSKSDKQDSGDAHGPQAANDPLNTQEARTFS
jgi:hypothetical protein